MTLPTLLLLSLTLACSDKDGGDSGATGDGGGTDGGSADGGSGDGGSGDGGSDGGSDGGAPDADSDGYAADVDCDDDDPTVNPGALEIFDEVDNDCNDAVDDLPHWTYDEGHEEEIGPSEWAERWPACGGDAQSPVDVVGDAVVEVDPRALEIRWADTQLHVTNNGHTLEWTVEGGSTLSWEGEEWPLVQFHLHASSEHRLSGLQSPLELHFVHKLDNGTATVFDDRYVVVALLVEEGEPDEAGIERPNAFLDAIGWDRLPAEHDEIVADSETTFSPTDALPADWYEAPYLLTYQGSLTTPPCLEAVQWIILGAFLEASTGQLDTVRALYDHNFREPQDLNGREIAFGLVDR